MTTFSFVIDKFQPTTLNALLHTHPIKAGRMKRGDRELVAYYARRAGIPTATGRRRVSLTITLAKGQRGADVDAYWKTTLDALTAAGLLIDDNRQNCELGSVEFNRGAERSTAILLEDLAPPAQSKPLPERL